MPFARCSHIEEKSTIKHSARDGNISGRFALRAYIQATRISVNLMKRSSGHSTRL